MREGRRRKHNVTCCRNRHPAESKPCMPASRQARRKGRTFSLEARALVDPSPPRKRHCRLSLEERASCARLKRRRALLSLVEAVHPLRLAFRERLGDKRAKPFAPG